MTKLEEIVARLKALEKANAVLEERVVLLEDYVEDDETGLLKRVGDLE